MACPWLFLGTRTWACCVTCRGFPGSVSWHQLLSCWLQQLQNPGATVFFPLKRRFVRTPAPGNERERKREQRTVATSLARSLKRALLYTRSNSHWLTHTVLEYRYMRIHTGEHKCVWGDRWPYICTRMAQHKFRPLLGLWRWEGNTELKGPRKLTNQNENWRQDPPDSYRDILTH